MAESSEQNARIQRVGQRHILYDAALIEHPDAALFSPAAQHDHGAEPKTAAGRGEAVFFNYQGQSLVYKHYHRGGMVARFLGDRYLGFQLKNTRSFREWRLLARLQQLGLPAPVPVAASVNRQGIFNQADLVTRAIPGVTPLADRLMHAELDAAGWRAIGQCIRRFHDHDVFHADLNARNILLNENDRVFLVDFDKGCIRLLGDSWKASNLARLQRSLLKFKASSPGFHFSTENWSDLLAAYSASPG